jgi:transcription initiation factor IIE alpha subunit
MKFLTFTCPKCGSHELEELCCPETVVSPITRISVTDDGEVDLEYGPPRLMGDIHEEGFQCADCGFVLSKYGNQVCESEELAKWLERSANRSPKG